MEAVSTQFPAELRQYKAYVDTYMQAKLRQFGVIMCRRLGPTLTAEQTEHVLAEGFRIMAQQDAASQPPRNLRLVIRHDCQSTGCGDMQCQLCMFNPSRLCTRNVKQKYLIDDHLKAKCGAPLRVELVDESGNCHTEGLLPGVQLEMHVLNGEKYKELCPDNTLLSPSQIKNCIITHHVKALLKREGASDDQLRVTLQLERGQGAMSDLALTTSSEALLAGKAPTFRLLVWAVDASGEPVAYVTYVVSESFVVATKRVKHAIKSDIPSITDHISKLLHIGKATVDKLQDLRQAFMEEGFEMTLPDQLVRVERVGQFKELMELSEGNADVKGKLRHVLKLSPEKWEEVCQHALSAVMPDFRNRIWWCQGMAGMPMGLLYACRNGAVMTDNPIALVKAGPAADSHHNIVPVQNVTPQEFNMLPRLKQQALQSWYMKDHPGWGIYNEHSGADGPHAGPAVAGGLPNVGLMAGLLPLPGPGAYGAGGPPLLGMVGVKAEGNMQAASPTQAGFPDGFPDPFSGGALGGAMPPPRGSAGALQSMMPGPPPPPAATGNRLSSSSPFAMMQQHPTQPPGALPPASGSGRDAGGASTSGHGLPVPRIPSATQHPANAAAAAAAAVAAGQGGALGAPPGAQGGPSTTAFAAANALMANIANAFPSFAQAGGSGGAARSGSGTGAGDSHGAGSAVMFPLDPLNTNELMDRGYSTLLGGLGSLAGDRPMGSTEWLLGGGNSLLQGNNSYTMIDAAPAGGAQEGDPAGQPDGGLEGGGAGVGGMHTRRLSMKLNSMSLDLDKVIAEHEGGQ